MNDRAIGPRQSERAGDPPARDLRLPYAAWAWEYLRRNKDYGRAYRASFTGRARPIPLNTGAILIREKRRWSDAEQWGLLSFADPEKSCDEANVFWRPDRLAGALPVQLVRFADLARNSERRRHDEIELRRIPTRRGHTRNCRRRTPYCFRRKKVLGAAFMRKPSLGGRTLCH